MLALQNDVHSENDLFAAERFVYAVDHASKPSARAKQAADLMRNWDGRMLASSAAPTIAVRSVRELTRLLLEPQAGTCAGRSEAAGDNLELEDLLMGDAIGVAGEYSAASAQALAAGKIFRTTTNC